MEKKMETTILYRGNIEVILGLISRSGEQLKTPLPPSSEKPKLHSAPYTLPGP